MPSTTTPLRTEVLPRPDSLVPPMAVDVPATWVPTPATDAVLAGFMDDGTLSPAYGTNIVLTGAALPEGIGLEDWQITVRDRQLSALPDLQVLDDRRLPALGGDTSAEQWYHCSVMTDRHGATVLTRRWNRLVPGLGLTLTLTTLPLLDAEHGDLFDAIAASWTITEPTTEERADDHA